MACAEEAVVLDRGDCRLEGTLSRPDATGTRGTIVLIVAGSGPTDRDGNGLPLGLRTDALKQVAAALAEGGVATLRYDKRGVGRSVDGATDEHALRFDAYVADAAAWVRELAADPRFDRVAVLGHSEGASIAARCALVAPVAAVISVAGTARPAGELLRRQLVGRLPASLAIVHESILAGLEAGRTTQDVPAELRVLYRPSVQPYLISWLGQRPLDAVAALEVPLLVVHGAPMHRSRSARPRCSPRRTPTRRS